MSNSLIDRDRSRYRGIRLAVICSAFASAMYSLSAQAEHVFVYRWIDDAGQVQYSDTAPLDSEVQIISIDKAPPVDTVLQRRFAAMDKLTKQAITEGQHRRAARRLDMAVRAARKQNCDQLTTALARLESRPGPKLLIVGPDGNARRMTEEERQRKMSRTTQKIARECGDAQVE